MLHKVHMSPVQEVSIILPTECLFLQQLRREAGSEWKSSYIMDISSPLLSVGLEVKGNLVLEMTVLEGARNGIHSQPKFISTLVSPINTSLLVCML